MTTASVSGSEVFSQIDTVFAQQLDHQQAFSLSSAGDRIEMLNRLEKALIRYKQAFRDAMWADFRKPAMEVDATEIYVVLSEIRTIRKNLRRWMRPRKVGAPLALLGSKGLIRYESKGVVLIISPWNFPVNLTLGPLVAAIAAGNTAIIKPSEYTVHTSRVLAELVEEIFEPQQVALFEGGVEVAQHLLAKPFHHIFFTGSTAVGKVVMKAASEHLTSVTLELGGKSPTIIDDTANLTKSVRRIVWGKLLNKGQICVSPDYLLVHASVYGAFLEEARKAIQEFYGDSPATSKDYARIVDKRHFQRLERQLDQALEEGAEIVYGGGKQAEERLIEPTIVTNVKPDASLLQEEIFGPLLPVVQYQNLDEAIAFIQERPRPLAMYIYSRSKKNIRYLIRRTRSGGVVINHNVVHFFNNRLPFGGVNESGLGQGHGFYGFQAFSNARSIQRHHFTLVDWVFFPPYRKWKQRIINFLIKYI
jgi:aldehyde dehydrogenase (NAD+)